MESNEEKLARLEKTASETLKEIKELKQSTSTLEPIPGKWYRGYSKINKCDWLFLFKGMENDLCTHNGAFSINDNFYYFESGIVWSSEFYKLSNIRLATEVEIRPLLEKEAIRMGFKAGVSVKYPAVMGFTSVNKLKDNDVHYRFASDVLYMGGYVIYQKGHWAEIVKDDIIKICGKEVLLNNYHVCIDGTTYSKSELQAIKSIMDRGQVKGLVVGCNSQETIKIDVIERILAKFYP